MSAKRGRSDADIVPRDDERTNEKRGSTKRTFADRACSVMSGMDAFLINTPKLMQSAAAASALQRIAHEGCGLGLVEPGSQSGGLELLSGGGGHVELQG